jgi:hypothetical protein
MQAPAEDSTAYTGGRAKDSVGGYETCAVMCGVHGDRQKVGKLY